VMDQPRIFKLIARFNGSVPTWVVGCTPEPARPPEGTRVVELEPMLDLLGRWFESRPLRKLGNEDGLTLDRETEALLRAHGRLQGDSDA
jgi:hypothetical protein